jgi:hypothetical protein
MAARHVCHHDVIARHNSRYLAADGLDNSGTFVTEYKWEWRGKQLVADDHVRVANTGGNYLDHYFVWLRISESELFERESTARGADDGCSNLLWHEMSPGESRRVGFREQ